MEYLFIMPKSLLPKLMEWMYTATNVSLWIIAFKTKDTGYLYMYMRRHLKKFYEIAHLDLNDCLNIFMTFF